MRPAVLVAFTVAIPLSVAFAQDDAVKKERAKFQGVWQVHSSEEDSQPTPEFIVRNLKLVIKDDQISLMGVEELMKQFGKITLTIDPTTMPRIIDFKVEAGAEKDKLFEGIYTLMDDELKICASTRSGGNRPSESRRVRTEYCSCFAAKREVSEEASRKAAEARR